MPADRVRAMLVDVRLGEHSAHELCDWVGDPDHYLDLTFARGPDRYYRRAPIALVPSLIVGEWYSFPVGQAACNLFVRIEAPHDD